jgi:endonuclease/exonuclease/phosphatase (EEP) superfamily protein YafD
MAELMGTPSHFPVRINVMTLNAWGTHRWPERKESLQEMIQVTRPDLLLIQENSSEIMDAVTEALPYFQRISGLETGWTCEGNIMFDSRMFEIQNSGFADLSMVDCPHRGLFHARFTVRGVSPPRTFFLCTAHLPWSGCPSEVATGVCASLLAARQICQVLPRLIHGDEPLILGGDFNNDFHPVKCFKEFGLTDIFSSLDLSPPITHPVRPSAALEEALPNRTLDWICTRGCRVVSAYVKSVRGGSGGVAPLAPPSDHMPVSAVLEL